MIVSAVVIAAVWKVERCARRRTDPSPPAVTADAPRPRARVVAKVGTLEITTDDVARHAVVRRATLGVVPRPQLLDDLVERALWTLAGRDAGLELPPEAVAQELLRERALLGRLAAPEPRVTAHGPRLRPEPPRLPTVIGVPTMDRPSDAALAAEAEADAYVRAAKDRLVYSKLELSPPELYAEYARGETAAHRRPRAHPSEAMLAQAAYRLRRERGASAVAGVLAELRAKWPVQTF